MVPHARLLELSIIEILNFGFAELLNGLDSKQRAYVLASLEGRVGPGGGIIVNDPDLPSSMQGMEAPDWWSDAPEDPFSDTFSVG